jgi:serine protease Do
MKMARSNRPGNWSSCLALLAFASLPVLAVAQEAPKNPGTESVLRLEEQLVEVVRKVSPTFVVIGGGSGVVISPDGWMLTNHHVAGDRPVGADWTVKLPSGKIYDAKLVGTDPTGDISLLKIAVKEGEALPYVEFGDSDSCRVGQWVVALGNPFGFAKDSKPTVTFGLISAFHRYRGTYGDAIQTDAPINSGNSGGPLARH